MVGNQIRKVIEILYAGQKYYIEDHYTLSTLNNSEKSTITIPQTISSQSQSSSPPPESSNKDSDKINNKKFCLFKKSRGRS